MVSTKYRANAVKDKALVLRLRFDEGAGSYANNGFIRGGLYFDGVNDYLRTPQVAALDPAEISIVCWVRRDTDDLAWIFGRGASSACRLMMYATQLTIEEVPISGVGRIFTAAATLSTGSYYQIVFTYDGQYMRFYVNSVLIGTSPEYVGALTFTPLQGWDLGCGTYSGYVNPLKGLLNEILFYDHALTQDEIIDVYNNRAEPSEEGLLIYYPITDDADDKSGNGYDATIHGASWITPSWVTGKYGKALKFVFAEKDWLRVPNDNLFNFGTGDFTINLHLKKALYDSAYEETLISKVGNVGHPDGYNLMFRDYGMLWFQKNLDEDPLIAWNTLLYDEDNYVDDPDNPVHVASQEWENGVLTEQSDFKINDDLYWRWYRGGFPTTNLGFATSTDGVHWTPYAGNPIDLGAQVPLGTAQFPYVVKDGDTFYLFIENISTWNTYLYDVTDPYNPVILNGGNPVLEVSQDWEDGCIYNVAVAIVDGVWHMLYEAGSGGNDFTLGYSHSTLAEMDWTSNKSANNPLFRRSCPCMYYVPERNALLVLQMTGYSFGDFKMVAYYAYLTDDLDLASSWHSGAVMRTPLQPDGADADASICMNYSNEYPLMIAWGQDQVTISQMYIPMTLTEFFDSIIVDDDKWNMLTITNKAGALKLYWTAKLRKTGVWTGNVQNTFPLTIGRWSCYLLGGLENRGWLDANIDEVRLYNRALSAAEVLYLYNNNNSALMAGRVVYPGLDEVIVQLEK